MNSSGSYSNLELAKEARTTPDCERQQELAEHPSALVRWNLVRNLSLCQSAREFIGEAEVVRLLQLTEESVRNVLDERG